ncbi:hypothetical protein M0R45_032682 [Rubus argutus]|uniref:Uncharacterized protein n=1 Tax=Rubus argutus TaxID=59490 RepID=A0AAW1WJE9_RUBAR
MPTQEHTSYHPSAGDFIDDQIQTPNQLIKVSNELTEDAFKKGMESLELPAPNGDILANVNSKAAKALQFDVFLLPDAASQHLNQDSGKENSPKDRRYNSNIDHHSDKEGSIFLLSNKGQQSILNTPNLARHSGTVTPSSKHNEWYPSIQKSISRLRIPEPSPRASSLKEGIEKLKCRLSSYSSPNAPLSTVLADISKDLQFAFTNSPTTFMEKQLAIGDLEKTVQKSLVNIDSNGNENPVNISKLGKDEKSTDPAKDEESLHHMFNDTLSKDKHDKPIEEVALPSQLSASGSKLTQHLLMSENPTKGALVSSGTHSLLADEPEENFPHVQIQSENNFQTPLSGAGILKFQSRSPAKNFQAGLEPQSKPYVCRSKTEPSLQRSSYKVSASNPSMEEPSQSPPRAKRTPRKEPIQPFEEEPIRSPIVKDAIQSLFLKEPTQCPFGSSYAEHTDNMRLVGKDMRKFGGESVDTKWKSWTDIAVKFSGDSEQLLSPLTSNLNLNAIGVLEDILMQLLKAKKYEMLCAEIQSQVCLNNH